MDHDDDDDDDDVDVLSLPLPLPLRLPLSLPLPLRLRSLYSSSLSLFLLTSLSRSLQPVARVGRGEVRGYEGEETPLYMTCSTLLSTVENALISPWHP